jgi:hypothetical protein
MTTETPIVQVSETEYKGNKLLCFTEGEKDRFPFSFGKTKASRLLGYIQQNGVEKFAQVLTEFVAKQNKTQAEIAAEA